MSSNTMSTGSGPDKRGSAWLALAASLIVQCSPWGVQSPSRWRRRLRARGSSSMIRMCMGSGYGGGAVEGQAQLHLKGVRFVALLHLKIHVVQQLQAVA